MDKAVNLYEEPIKLSRFLDDYSLIEIHGEDVISSKIFQRVAWQRHHIFSTVGYHSVHVAMIMVILSRLFKMDLRDIIRASLWHDVGIYDRESFRKVSMGYEHPKRSLKLADSLDALDETERDMIAHHMWPMCKEMPETLEGVLITIADKWCAVTEFLGLSRSKKIIEMIKRPR